MGTAGAVDGTCDAAPERVLDDRPAVAVVVVGVGGTGRRLTAGFGGGDSVDRTHASRRRARGSATITCGCRLRADRAR